MPHIPRQPGEDSLHDHVIALLATHWYNPSNYNLTTNPNGEQNRWVGSERNQQWPDLVAWRREGDRDKPVWIAEVETVSSVNETEARNQWRAYAALTKPLYLVVPTGYATTARRIVANLGISIDGYYEFTVERGQLQLSEV